MIRNKQDAQSAINLPNTQKKRRKHKLEARQLTIQTTYNWCILLLKEQNSCLLQANIKMTETCVHIWERDTQQHSDRETVTKTHPDREHNSYKLLLNPIVTNSTLHGKTTLLKNHRLYILLSDLRRQYDRDAHKHWDRASTIKTENWSLFDCACSLRTQPCLMRSYLLLTCPLPIGIATCKSDEVRNDEQDQRKCLAPKQRQVLIGKLTSHRHCQMFKGPDTYIHAHKSSLGSSGQLLWLDTALINMLMTPMLIFQM